tara:strand:- start:863 stop:2182 length:1320 start_codon:yes stop_codon:yes gene_type:complete
MTILGFGRNASASDNSDSNRDHVAKDGIVPLKVEAKSAQKKYKRNLVRERIWKAKLDEFIRKNPECDDTGASGYYTVKEVIENFKPTLEAFKKQKNRNIKKDGALDKLRINSEITGSIKMSVEDILINTLTQRVTGIKDSKIIKMLKEAGGFLHSKCVIKLLAYPNQDMLVCFDGMHRIIMAYLCGVKEIKVNIVEAHDPEDTFQQMLNRERELIKVENIEGEKLDKGDIQRIDQTSNNLTPDQKRIAGQFKSLNIGFKGFGAKSTKDKYGKVVAPKYSFSESYGNFAQLIDDVDSVWFVGIGDLKEYLEICHDIWPDAKKSQKYCAIAKCLDVLKTEPDVYEHFKKYLKSTDFTQHKESYWTRKNIHDQAIPHMITRVLLRFNEWYRTEIEDQRVITDEMIAPFLADNIMPQEMRNHAYYCLEMDKTFDDTFFLDEEV